MLLYISILKCLNYTSLHIYKQSTDYEVETWNPVCRICINHGQDFQK